MDESSFRTGKVQPGGLQCAGGTERKFANSAFILSILRSQDLKPPGAAASVKDRFYLGLSKIKIPWKIVNNGTKQYVIFNYQYFLFVILYENRQYYYPAWSWLIVALFTICCWPSRPTFPFSLRIRSAWRKCWAFRPTKYCDQSYNEPRSYWVILPILIKNDK